MKRNMSIFNNTGVSETIGFVLILGIVITGIGLVTLYGYPVLLQQQQNANIKNMEKNMIVLQNDIKGLAYRNVPYTETTMQISGGTLQVIRPNPPPGSTLPGGRSNFIITVAGIPIGTYYTGLLQFNSTSDSALIGLQNGAVVTNGFSQTDDLSEPSAMLSEPRWFLDTNQSGGRTLVISIVNITSGDMISTSGGIRTVQMNISAGTPIEAGSGDVTIEYQTLGDGYSTAWRNYFNNRQVFPLRLADLVSFPPDAPKLTLKGIDRTVIKTYNVTILNL